MKAISTGCGIAELASALALTRRGWQVEVLERAPEFTEAGAPLPPPRRRRPVGLPGRVHLCDTALRLLASTSFARSLASVLDWAALTGTAGDNRPSR